MPEDTLNPVEVNESGKAQAPAIQKIDKGTYSLEYVNFTRGETQALGYWTIQFNSVQAAIDRFTSLGKKGEEIVLGLLNQAAANNLRGRANSRVPVADTNEAKLALIAEKIRLGEQVLVSQAEAESFVPGSRERTVNSLWKDYEAARAEAVAAKDSGDTATYNEKKSEAMELLEQYKVARAAQEAAAEAAINSL